MRSRNRFYIDGEVEYLENYTLQGEFLQRYYQRHNSEDYLYAKVYIKADDNTALEAEFRALGFNSFTHTHTKKMLIGVINTSNMGKLKKMVNTLWDTYRTQRNTPTFNLGKQ